MKCRNECGKLADEQVGGWEWGNGVGGSDAGGGQMDRSVKRQLGTGKHGPEKYYIEVVVMSVDVLKFRSQVGHN